MKRDPLTGIGILESTIDYSDRSEDRIQAILRAAEDRSSRSDELASHITDWPSRYHFSRTRAHLLAPLDLCPDMRILDVGCGTGPITRALGESGAEVLGVEGSLDRARAAAIRCEDLPRVEILCGDIDRLEGFGRFDLICCIGVLEYSASRQGGERGPAALLEKLYSLLRPGGTLLLAIENKLGLKYLLGYREDHIGLPWVGLEGYPVGFGARTWSRKELAALLRDAGFRTQRWFFPFPDYKTPSLILGEEIYGISEGDEVVDQLVRLPVEDFAYPRTMITDDRAVHRSFLKAGLGPEVANSFLVLASGTESDLDEINQRGVLAWHLGGERRQLFKRKHRLKRNAEGLVIECRGLGSAVLPQSDWLKQRPDSRADLVMGSSLEQLFLESCSMRDEAGVSAVLKLWLNTILDSAETAGEHQEMLHPFSPRPGRRMLPEDMADLGLSNFILPANGDFPILIDREWLLDGGIDFDLGILHALWFQALDLIRGGGRHPWDEALSVEELALHLCRLAGVEIHPQDIEGFYLVESEFQARITAREVAAVLKDLRASGRRTQVKLGAVCPFRWTELSSRCQETPSSDPEAVAEMDDIRQSLEREVGLLKEKNSRLEEENTMWRAWRSAFESRFLVRLYRRFRRPRPTSHG